MRHQPSLRREVIKALVHVVEEIITKAQDEQIQVSSRPNQPAPTVESAKKEEPETIVEPAVEESKSFSQTMNEWNGFSADKLQTLRDGLEKR
jgi:cell envelope opacity-associated protein A